MKKNIISQETANILFKINAVSFRFNPPFTYTTGLKSPIYLDNRIVMSYPKERKKIVDFYIQTIKENIGLENVDCISATASAAIPQGSWVSGKLNLPMVYVRPSTKSYGKGNKVEGYLKKGSSIVIIEDHVSTAESIVNNAQAIRELGGKVKYCIASTTYETQKSIDNLKGAKIKLIALVTGKQIADEAFKKKLLSEKEKLLVDFWFKDPVKWGEQYSI